ncbi:polymorphic toxin type 35 domain-containing protein, partial [Brevibacillus laterosporus]
VGQIDNRLLNYAKIDAGLGRDKFGSIYDIFYTGDVLILSEVASSVAGVAYESIILTKRGSQLVKETAKILKSSKVESVIKVFDKSVIKIEHIFSKKHINNGIMDLGKNQNEILEKFINTVKTADSKGMLKEGMNQIQTIINGHEAEIRVFVSEGKVLNLDGFKGFSTRKMGNSIKFP